MNQQDGCGSIWVCRGFYEEGNGCTKLKLKLF